MQIPSFINDLATTPADFKDNFVKKFSKEKEDRIDELIEIFGRSNLAHIEVHLPQHVMQKVNETLKIQSFRFERFLKIALKDIIGLKPLDLESLGKFFTVSILEGETIQENVIKEMAKYLFSLSMPFHESHYWKCYKIPAIALCMNNHRTRLNDEVAALFQRTLPQEEEVKQPFRLTLEQEQILFRSPAIKGHGIVISFLQLLTGWAASSEEGANFEEELATNLFFDKLLVPKVNKSEKKPRISFAEFFVKQTLFILFHHRDSLLPCPSPVLKEGLAELFSQSFQAQQDVLYYIDYLHDLIKKEKENFPFKEALALLQSIVSNRTSLAYSFLHSSLHFFHWLAKFPFEKEEAPDIFKSIHALRADYDDWIYEKIGRKPLQFNSKFIPYCKEKGFPLEEIGRIVLKFSITVSTSDTNTIPFLSQEEHIDLLQDTEKIFGIAVPREIAIYFLLFQSVTPEAINIFNDLVQIRLKIITEYLNTLAIPSELYHLLAAKSSALLEVIESNSNERINSREERFVYYPLKVIQFSSLLHFAVYPRQSSFFSDLMPLEIIREKFLFKRGEQLQNRLEPINRDLPEGPARFCCWDIDSKGRACFNFSILSALQPPKSACIAKIPLLISLEKLWTPAFFMLLAKFIDAFGNESLTEDEEREVNKITPNDFHPPDECLKMEGSVFEIFDAFLSHFPQLEKLWNETAELFENDLDEVKAALYFFIQTLRSSYKKSFYLTLSQNCLGLEVSFTEKEHIQRLDLECGHKDHEVINPMFDQIYQEMSQVEWVLLGSKVLLENGLLILRVSRESNESLIKVELEIHEEHHPKAVTVFYESFIDKEHFFSLMHWQLKFAECREK